MITSKVCRLHAPEDMRIESQDVAAPGADEVRVRVVAAGICGTDLHYYYHGGFGDVRIKAPFIPGHEFAGIVESAGENVQQVKTGDKVAVNPSAPCMQCSYCLSGDRNHCTNMFFLGSAMRNPHVNGGFCEMLVVHHSRCVKLPQDSSLVEAASVEPLAVVLHAANLLDNAADRQPEKPFAGKKILITGAGPIGCLMAAVCRFLGAADIVITDLTDYTLSVAREMGATTTVNVSSHAGEMEQYKENKGRFDIAFECSSALAAVTMALQTLRPKGKLIQVGMAGNMDIPMNLIIGKEIQLTGSFRFDKEFEQAAKLISSRQIDVRPMITRRVDFQQAADAFTFAADRNSAVKVQLKFCE